MLMGLLQPLRNVHNNIPLRWTCWAIRVVPLPGLASLRFGTCLTVNEGCRSIARNPCCKARFAKEPRPFKDHTRSPSKGSLMRAAVLIAAFAALAASVTAYTCSIDPGTPFTDNTYVCDPLSCLLRAFSEHCGLPFLVVVAGAP